MPAPTGTRIVDAPSATLVHSSLVPESWRKMLARSAPRRAWVALAISVRRWSRSEVTARRRETSRTSRIFSAEMEDWTDTRGKDTGMGGGMRDLAVSEWGGAFLGGWG